MKSVMMMRGFAMASTLLAAGCDGKASPETGVTCTNDVTIGAPAGQTSLFLVTKGVEMNDEGAAGPVPANGILVTIISPIDEIQACEGDCDAGDSFDQEQDVVTNEFGLLQYTIGIDAVGLSATSGVSSFDIVESFNSVSQCNTTVNIN